MKCNFSRSLVGMHKIIPETNNAAYCKLTFWYLKPINIKKPKTGIDKNNLYFLKEIVQKTSNILNGYRKTLELILLIKVIANNDSIQPNAKSHFEFKSNKTKTGKLNIKYSKNRIILKFEFSFNNEISFLSNCKTII